jgi:sRNA-binding protein
MPLRIGLFATYQESLAEQNPMQFSQIELILAQFLSEFTYLLVSQTNILDLQLSEEGVY